MAIANFITLVGTAGGDTQQVQYNDAGYLAGNSGFIYNNSSYSVTISGNLGIGTSPLSNIRLHAICDRDPASNIISHFQATYNNAYPMAYQFYRHRDGAAGQDSDGIANLDFYGHNDAGTPEIILYSTIINNIVDASDGAESGLLNLKTIYGGSTSHTGLILSGDRLGLGIDSTGWANFGELWPRKLQSPAQSRSPTPQKILWPVPGLHLERAIWPAFLCR